MPDLSFPRVGEKYFRYSFPILAAIPEQTRKLSPMRRQDMAGEPMMAGFADQGERVGIEHQRLAAGERRVEPGPRALAASETGTSDDRGDTRIL